VRNESKNTTLRTNLQAIPRKKTNWRYAKTNNSAEPRRDGAGEGDEDEDDVAKPPRIPAVIQAHEAISAGGWTTGDELVVYANHELQQGRWQITRLLHQVSADAIVARVLAHEAAAARVPA